MWKKFKGDVLPQPAIDMVDSVNGWQFGACYVEAWYKNDGKEPKDWIVTTDNGGFYKVDAICMTWYYDKDYDSSEYNPMLHTYPNPELGKHIIGRANWSNAALKRTIKAIKEGKAIPSDPNYQT